MTVQLLIVIHASTCHKLQRPFKQMSNSQNWRPGGYCPAQSALTGLLTAIYLQLHRPLCSA